MGRIFLEQSHLVLNAYKLQTQKRARARDVVGFVAFSAALGRALIGRDYRSRRPADQGWLTEAGGPRLADRGWRPEAGGLRLANRRRH